MKTSKLIELAREYAEEYGHDSQGGITIPFPRDKLLELADKLEMACKDMKYGIENVGCDVCEKSLHHGDGWCDKCEFVWRGDEQ